MGAHLDGVQAAVLPLGALTPLVVYRYAARATIVERLREAEG